MISKGSGSWPSIIPPIKLIRGNWNFLKSRWLVERHWSYWSISPCTHQVRALILVAVIRIGARPPIKILNWKDVLNGQGTDIRKQLSIFIGKFLMHPIYWAFLQDISIEILLRSLRENPK